MPFYLGLDGEMTGGDVFKNELCQIGLATETGEKFESDIRCTLEHIDDDAMAVHGIDRGWLKEGAPAPAVVDQRATEWFNKQTKLAKAIPVGWGVSYFDMPFVRRTLPQLAQRISRQSMELGAAGYLLAKTLGLNPKTLKNHAKKYAESMIGETSRWHNAGYDALAAIYGFEYYQRVIKNGGYL